jgi:GAF domain-containing protein
MVGRRLKATISQEKGMPMQSNKIRSISQIFAPKFPPGWSKLDPETLRQARVLNTLLNLLIVTSLFVFVNVFFSSNPLFDTITTVFLLGFVLLTRWLLLRGFVRASAILLTGGLWLTLVGATFINQFEGNGPFIGLVLVVIVAGMLLGSKAGFTVALLSTVVGFIHLGLSQSENGVLPVIVPYDPLGYMVTMGIIFFGLAGLVYLVTSSLKEAVATANKNEQAMAESNQELEKMRYSLEDQVAERTKILEQRTGYLQAAIEVSRATASILDTQELIQNSVDLVCEQFGLYYVGLFQIDPSGKWAILQAGTGEAGKAMLARGHRIRFGQGMIGWCIANAQPRLAGEVVEDQVRLPTTELPETRSEAAIPLRSRGHVIGALTVQSNQPDAFGEMEITIFQALADQLAIALDNARLIAESQQAVKETQSAYGRMSRNAWTNYLATLQGQNNIYRYGIGNTVTTNELEQSRQEVLKNGQIAQVRVGDQLILLLPITVRDQVIGVINFSKEPVTKPAKLRANGHKPSNRIQPSQEQTNETLAWSAEEVNLLRAIAEQLGVAVDSARLYAETRQHAEHERLVDQVSSEMRASLDIDKVLETTVRELRDALGLAEVEVRLGDGA